MANVKLIAYTQPADGSGDPMQACREAASICYDSKPSNAIVKGCYKSGHESVLEHCSFTFRISGISRACSMQLIRHRLASFSQRSQRYCDEEGFEYVTPSALNDSPVKNLYDEFMGKVSEFYAAIKSGGVPQEDARSVLPNACCTEIVVTMNLREICHFMNLRLCTRAQKEIRDMATLMREEILKVCPSIDYMLVPKCYRNFDSPLCTERNCCGRAPKLKDIYSWAMEYKKLMAEDKKGE